jgi:hypothetical protein
VVPSIPKTAAPLRVRFHTTDDGRMIDELLEDQ